MRRLLVLLPLLVGGPPATAHAAAERVGEPVDRRCDDALRPGAPGVATQAFTAARGGYLTVRLRGDGDWDLALYASRRGSVASSEAFGGHERLTAYVPAGRTWTIQICRRTGADPVADLDSSFYEHAPPARLRPRHARRAARGAADVGRSALPSGDAAYRTLGDYERDLKALAGGRAGLVRPLVLGRSVEGRPIEGVELSENVARTDDGRPVLALVGLHHAREWPSGEMPMEFATDLVARYEAGDAGATALLRRLRVVVVPVANPDGFDVSRSAGGDQGANDSTLSPPAEYRRKNCAPTTAAEAAIPCGARPAASGVDLNRNVGAYWGGAGSSSSPASDVYRGPAPFSEPESQAFHAFSQTRAPVVVISHHTFTSEGEWLRQPGFCAFAPAGCDEGDVIPDEAETRDLGDRMAQATGWRSDLGWRIGEITGATEDWNAFATGAYGFTSEQRGQNFHGDFATAVVAEYDGTAQGAQGGMREALMRAAAEAADRRAHAVITGAGAPGATLHLTKSFTTPTSQPGVSIPDGLDLRLTVPADGRFTWDVNPSTRPLAPAKEAYTLRCEAADGTVLATRDVIVDRGRQVDAGDACTPLPPAAAAPASTPTAAAPAAGEPRGPALTFRLARRQKRATVLRRGLLVRATCAVDCRLGASVRRSSAGAILGSRTLALRAGRAVAFRVRLGAAARRTVVRRALKVVVLRLDARAAGVRRVQARRVQLVR